MTSKQVTDAFSLYKVDLKAAVKEMEACLGDLDEIEVWGNQVLLGVFVRPETTGSGLVFAPTANEDIWQGKVGRILKIGPDAFPEDAKTFNGKKPKVGEWVYHNINEITIQHFYAGPGFVKEKRMVGVRKDVEQDVRAWTGWPIRVVEDARIYGRVKQPQSVL